ncbi:MAG TPA: T9SS type A sorting domain-containing protein [bacterium]|jgi:hypothetical protein
MRRVFITVMLLVVVCIVPAYSQMTLVVCDPANGGTAGLSDTLSWIYSAAIDTAARWNNPGACVAVLSFDPPNFEVTDHRFSHDLRVMALMVDLQANTDYVWAFTNIRSTTGDSLGLPIVGMFTTATSVGQRTVSGHVTYAGNSDGAIVALLDHNPDEDTDHYARAGAVLTAGDGNYTVSYVRDGTYWPVVVRDINHDGEIDDRDEGGNYDPNHDGLANSITVSGDNLTQIDFEMGLIANGAIVHHGTLPTAISLSQNYPNPFNPTTEIQFALPSVQKVKLSVFDMLGREIAVLASGTMSAGSHTAQFDGAGLPSGIYFYRLTAGSFSMTQKMLLVK